jgi:branched-chain amino acid transport system permease protein
MEWVNQILQGVLLGGYYALIACGLSFMFSVMGIVNLAHGSLAVVAAACLWFLAEHYALSPFLGLLIVLPGMAMTGWVLQRVVLDRSMRGGMLVPLLATFGLAVVIDNVLFEVMGADTRSLAPFIGKLAYDSWDITDDIEVGKLALLTFIVAVVVIGALQLLMARTHLGRSIRATSADADTAGLIGVDATRVKAISTSIAMMTVGLAGAALAMRSTFDPYAGGPQLICAFEAAVIGGTGSLWGTLLGGIVLGVAQSVGAKVNPQGFLIGGHVAFLCVLVLRLRFGTIASWGYKLFRAHPLLRKAAP